VDDGGGGSCKKLIGQGVGRQVGVGGGVGDGKRSRLVDCLGGDGGQTRRAVHFIDRDGEGVGSAQGRRAVVGHFDGEHHVVGGSLGLGGGPGDDPARVDGGVGRCDQQLIGEGIGRQVGIAGRIGDDQRGRFVD